MNTRLIAARVIAHILQEGQSLTAALDLALLAVETSKDKAFIQALCYGVCRYFYRLDFILNELLDKPLKDTEIKALALVGLYQLKYMRVKPHAAVSETVLATQKKPWAKALINALLRGYLRQQVDLEQKADNNPMVEALDKMVTESLTEEISEFQAERQAMNEDRVQAKQQLRESAVKFNNFMVTKLAEEIKELRGERKLQMESQAKLEQFIVHALAREIKEFTQDKQAVVEAKVKLVAEGRQQLEALKARFVSESAKRLNTVVTSHLKGELSQLKEDIKIARENNFGRRIFESFASEFSVTHLNDKAETRKLMNALQLKDQQLAESTKIINQSKKLIETKEREVRVIKESNQREKMMSDLLAPLNEEKV